MRRRQAGFTLLEVLLAITILAVLTTIMFSSFSQMVSTKRAVEATQERTHVARVALMRIAREIEMAFLSDAENTALQERRTMLMSTSHNDVTELRFSAFAHQRLRENSAEGDASVIMLYGERDPDDRRKLNLMRRETRRLAALDPKTIAGEAYVLCPNVARLQFQFYDFKNKQWKDDWNTMGADGLTYLPTQVRITLTIIDERDRQIPFYTEARIHMTERVAYRPLRQ